MRSGRPETALVLSNAARSQRQSFAHRRSLPAAWRTRARIVPSRADGELNSVIATRLALTQATVGKWHSRFIEHRISGLSDDVRPGKLRSIHDERLAHLTHVCFPTPPTSICG